MAFCRFCGTKLPNESLFCLQCGRLLAPASDTQQPPTPINQQQEDQKVGVIPATIPFSKQLSAENVPAVQGTPQIGSVPSVASSGVGTAASVATTMTAGIITKIIVTLAICAAVVVASVKVLPPIFLHQSPTNGPMQNVPVTVKMPPTQTNCPSGVQSRAAVMKTLAPGKDQNIVYANNVKTTNGTPISSTLYRYDVTTGKTIQIFRVENADMTDATVSADGQWVVFTSEVNSIPAIQMIRMDGQGWQTLYCSPKTQYDYQQSILEIHLSPDQKLLAFYTGLNTDQSTFDLLNMSDGIVRTALAPQTGTAIYTPVMWLSDTQLYVFLAPISSGGLFLLDLKNGLNQPASDLTELISPYPAGFDASPDHTKLFTSQCRCGQGIFTGPSSISMQSASGAGTRQQIIHTDATYAIESLLAFSNTSILFIIDTGVWKINNDGSGLVRLTGPGAGFFSLHESQDISHDGKWYLLAAGSDAFFSSTNGGPLKTFATSAVEIVGWTTM